MKKGLIIAIVIVVIIGGGIFALVHKSDKNTASAPGVDNSTATSEQTETGGSTDQTTDTNEQPAANATVISYDGRTFSPSSVTVTAGDSITVKNTSSDDVEFESDPHPAHTDNPELNIGTIAPGKSATITVKNKGTWGYHNHLDSSQTGTIIIQ